MENKVDVLVTRRSFLACVINMTWTIKYELHYNKMLSRNEMLDKNCYRKETSTLFFKAS